ncbi:probable protein S-acyltransferase 7 [Salvia splendens]|uniref:probable protein S-acyltransferase 7 n=1 Tax=Salvia splendens TaxID=180675 RepID=UPI001C27F0DE|nr:probable protein S-acyltransferase 7 [Salvia splendens]
MASTDGKNKPNDTVSNTLPETAESAHFDQPEITLSESSAKAEATVENAETKPNLIVLRQKLASAKRILSRRLPKSFHGDRTTRLCFSAAPPPLLPGPRGLVLTTMAIAMSSWSFAAYAANDVVSFAYAPKVIGSLILTSIRNYRLYIIFLFVALALFAYIFAFSFQTIRHRMSQNNVVLIDLLRNCPETLALASFTFAAALLLGVLTCYNLYFVALNQTAYENFHQYYASSQNPYDKGFLSNFLEVLCWSTPPPKVDFRGELRNVINLESITLIV